MFEKLSSLFRKSDFDIEQLVWTIKHFAGWKLPNKILIFISVGGIETSIRADEITNVVGCGDRFLTIFSSKNNPIVINVMELFAVRMEDLPTTKLDPNDPCRPVDGDRFLKAAVDSLERNHLKEIVLGE